MKKLLLLCFLLSIKNIWAQVPANDNCAAPQVVVIPSAGNICINSSNVNATSDNTTNTCDTGLPGNEVWFTYIATGAQNTITVSPTGSPAAQQLVVTIQNTNCASLTYNACGASATNGGTATANWVYTPGAQILISVETNGAAGNFQLCISSTTPPPSPGSSCATSSSLCNLNNFSVNSFPNNVNSFMPDCFFSSLQRPIFYQFTVGQTGLLQWTADVQGMAEYDWAIYNITNGCPTNNTNPLACNYNFANGNSDIIGMQPGPGTCSGEFCDPVTVTAGQTYMLIIDNFSDNSNGFNMSWTGSTFLMAPSASFTVTPTTACNSATATFTNSTTGANSQTWNFGDGTTFSGANPPPHNYNTPGTYLISLVTTSASGCNGSPASGSVTINPTPLIVAPSSITVCSGVSVASNTLIPTPNTATVSWSNSNPAIGLAANGTGNIPTFTAANATSSAITGVITLNTILNGCAGVPVTYTITVNPNVTSAVAGANQLTCSFNAGLSGNAPTTGTGTWSLVSGTGIITNPNLPNSSVTGLSVGVNVFQWSISNGLCPASTSTVSITVNAAPTISNAGSAQTICTNTITLAGNTPIVGTGTWSLVSGAGFIVTPNSPTTTVTGLGVGSNVFQWTITNVPCAPSSSQVTITTVATPTVTVPNNITICAGSTISASNFTSSPSGTSFNWTNNNASTGLLASGSGNTPSFTAVNNTNSPAFAVITVTPTSPAPASCIGLPVSYTITVLPNPTLANAGTSQTICINSATLSGNTPLVGTGLWTLISGTATITNPSSPNSTVTGLGIGANIFEWTITNANCPLSSSQVTINVVATPTVTVQNSITICAGSSVSASNFISNPSGASFGWVNSDASIGLASSGTGNTPSFVAINNGSAPVNAVITVTPTSAAPALCLGNPISYTITVNPGSTLSVNSATICAGQSATLTGNAAVAGGNYSWSNGETTSSIIVSPLSTTTYTLNYSIGGCPVSASGTVSINQSVSVNVNSVTICNGQSATLIASPNVVGGSYLWSNAGETTSSISLSPVTSGTYSVSYNLNGCLASGNGSIIVNPLPTITVNDATVCAGQAATLTANPSIAGGTYLWSPGNQTIASINFTPLTSSSYTVNYSLSGCNAQVVSNVTVNNAGTISAIDATICNGQTANLTSNTSIAGGTYTWLPGGETTAGISVLPGNTTTYTVVYVVQNCPTFTTSTVLVNPVPTVNASSTTICAGQSGNITATPSINGGTYSWINSSQTNSTITESPAVTTSYTVTYTLNGCSNENNGTITVNPLPIVNAGPATICQGEIATLLANTTMPGGNFIWSPGGETTASISISPITSATYTVNYSINGCNGTANTSVLVRSKPIASFAFPQFISISNPSVNFINGSSFATNYIWDFGDLLSPTTNNSTGQNPTHTYTVEGTYCVNLVAINNSPTCTDTIELCFEVEPQYTYYLPNAFSPNEDGSNDGFIGKGENIIEYEMSIFDRWGNKIFQTSDKDKQWDGKANGSGSVAQQDVYVYVVKIKDKFGENHDYVGSVTLVR
jgi:gliding motility-associated-like protein